MRKKRGGKLRFFALWLVKEIFGLFSGISNDIKAASFIYLKCK